MISIVVPVFRSADTLAILLRRIVQVFENYPSAYEVIFVEDGGGDSTWQVVEELSSKTPHVRGIRMSRNYGQHNALLCGLRAAKGEVTITLDDDLQNPPDEIPRLLDKLYEGFDVVYGTPLQQKHGLLRNLASRVTKSVLESSMGASNAKSVSAFRAFRTDLREAFSDFCSPTVNLDVLLTWATTRFTVVSVRHDVRVSGVSGYTPAMLLRHALDMLTGYSTKPLQIASLMGFVLASFGLLLFLYVFFNWIVRGSVVPGFAFLASVIVIFSGAQLIALGVIGEYLARVHFRTMGQPSYIVAEKTKEFTND